MPLDVAQQGTLFDVPERIPSRYPIHLRNANQGYALVVDTPNGARTDLLAGADWPSALERFLAEQQRTGLNGAITTASVTELTDVSRYESCAYPHLESERPVSFIELSQDTRQASLFPDLMPSPYRLMLTTHEGSIDLLVEQNRYSEEDARELMGTAHTATGLAAFDATGNERILAIPANVRRL